MVYPAICVCSTRSLSFYSQVDSCTPIMAVLRVLGRAYFFPHLPNSRRDLCRLPLYGRLTGYFNRGWKIRLCD